MEEHDRAERIASRILQEMFGDPFDGADGQEESAFWFRCRKKLEKGLKGRPGRPRAGEREPEGPPDRVCRKYAGAPEGAAAVSRTAREGGCHGV